MNKVCKLKFYHVISFVILACLITSGCSEKTNIIEEKISTDMWKKSGGDVLACFGSKSEAKLAQKEIFTEGYLKPQTASKIKKIFHKISWDHLVQNKEDVLTGTTNDDGTAEFVDVDDNRERYEQDLPFIVSKELLKISEEQIIIKKIIDYLSHNAPLIAERIIIQKERFPFSKWKKDDSLPEISDSIPYARTYELHEDKVNIDRKINEKNCVLIQISNQFSNENQKDTEGVAYSPTLYSLLSPLDRAILILNEYFSLAFDNLNKGKETRKFLIPYLMSLNYLDMAVYTEDIEYIRKKFSGTYPDSSEGILDYVFESKNKTFEYYFLKSSLLSMIKKINLHRKNCIKKIKETQLHMADDPNVEPNCTMSTLYEPSKTKQTFTPEEAFLFLARYELDTLDLGYNSDHLSTEYLKIDQTTPSAREMQIQAYCKELSFTEGDLYLEIYPKAQEYCKNKTNHRNTL